MKCGPSLQLLGLLFHLGGEARVAWAQQQEPPDGAFFHVDNEPVVEAVVRALDRNESPPMVNDRHESFRRADGVPHAWTEHRDSRIVNQDEDGRVTVPTKEADVGAHGMDHRMARSTGGGQGSGQARALKDEATSDGGGNEGNETMQDISNSEVGDNNDTATSDAINCTFGEELPLKHGFYALKHIVNPVEETITVEFTFNEEGWVSFGTNPNGKMVGGEVVIAKPNEPPSSTNPGKYSMSGQRADAVTLMKAQTLMNASWSQANGQTILRYTKLLREEGELEIIPDGSNTFIFAAGMSNDFADHGLRFGKVTLSSLDKCVVPGQAGDDTSANPTQGNHEASDSADSALWSLHGILMGTSWAILVPIGVGCSLVRSILPVRLVWFQLHMVANSAAFLLQTAAFGVALYMTSQDDEGHFQGMHKSVGLAVYVVSFVQVLSGFFRPQLLPSPVPPVTCPEVSDDDDNDHENESVPQVGPSKSSAQIEVEGGRRVARSEAIDSNDGYAGVGVDDDDVQDLKAPREIPRKSASRLAFEVGHRVAGFALIGLAWYNCSTGIDEMVAHYREFYDKSSVLWGVVGSLSGLIALLYAYQRFCWKGASRKSAMDEEIPCVQRS